METISKQVKYQRRHKELGLCQKCSQKAVSNRLLCPTHLYSDALFAKRYFLEHHADRIEYLQQRRKRLNEEGRCLRCGASLIDDEIGICVACYINRHQPMGVLV